MSNARFGSVQYKKYIDNNIVITCGKKYSFVCNEKKNVKFELKVVFKLQKIILLEIVTICHILHFFLVFYLPGYILLRY